MGPVQGIPSIGPSRGCESSVEGGNMRLQPRSVRHCVKPRAGEARVVERYQAELANIFTPSKPIEDPRLFSGRQQLLADLKAQLPTAGMNFVLYGERGRGRLRSIRYFSARESSAMIVLTRIASNPSFSMCLRASKNTSRTQSESSWHRWVSRQHHPVSLA